MARANFTYPIVSLFPHLSIKYDGSVRGSGFRICLVNVIGLAYDKYSNNHFKRDLCCL